MTASDGFPPHQDDHVPAENEGEWISNEPPVDDFGDPAAEAATVSEDDDVAHEHEDGDQDYAVDDVAPEAGEKKKFPILLLAGAVGSLIVVGALGYWQFGRHSEPMLDASSPVPAAATPSFASKSAAPVAAPAALDVAPTTGYSQPSPTVDSAVVAKAPVHSNAGVVEPTSAVTVVTEPTTAATMGTVVIPPPAANDTRLTVLSNRIDDLQKVLTQATEQLGQISEKLNNVSTNAATTAPVAVAAADPAMQERLNKLEQKVMQMEQQRQSATPASADEVYPSKATIKPRHTKTVKRASKPKVVVTRSAVAAKPTAKWVLRAATPEEAWIAKSVDSRDLRPVHVGDIVPGIGKITAIRQTGTVWSLQGTDGVVR